MQQEGMENLTEEQKQVVRKQRELEIAELQRQREV